LQVIRQGCSCRQKIALSEELGSVSFVLQHNPCASSPGGLDGTSG